MRKIQEFCEYKFLNFVRIEGERDKRGENIQKDLRRIPDFIIHEAGSNNNYLIMEVKKASSFKEVWKVI